MSAMSVHGSGDSNTPCSAPIEVRRAILTAPAASVYEGVMNIHGVEHCQVLHIDLQVAIWPQIGLVVVVSKRNSAGIGTDGVPGR